jgi:hypothetical protein
MPETTTPKRYWIWTVGCQMNRSTATGWRDHAGPRVPSGRQRGRRRYSGLELLRRTGERGTAGERQAAIWRSSNGSDRRWSWRSRDVRCHRISMLRASASKAPTFISSRPGSTNSPTTGPGVAGAHRARHSRLLAGAEAVSHRARAPAFVPISNGCDKFCTYASCRTVAVAKKPACL